MKVVLPEINFTRDSALEECHIHRHLPVRDQTVRYLDLRQRTRPAIQTSPPTGSQRNALASPKSRMAIASDPPA